ncbi:MFS transporter, DHA1 family, bicyclomycin/chloramphenicol resistance protein [Actinacidiphila yanglinensis]|uniref:MFS transporter, DHA1 family, bicyclomycin/chloramphenicol resistance protein n=1 Tax=Actinacidiphila yanglinensis TaxID=310779 RepID=A0A1H5SX05_9ACTN|nr:MFS transporter, DHA1 family, bicyclomycin/chloramphenicol resistance protein [Actinacidiphila yanglinensis]
MQDAGPDTPAQFTATPTPAHPPTHPTPPAPSRGYGPHGSREAQARTGLVVTLVLGGLTALPPLSMDMYLPALPRVSSALHAPSATVQLTLTACLGGMALGQLVVGPLSDRWGRRRPLLAGMMIYVVATVACVFAATAPVLIGFRLLQGLAGSAGIVIARAVVRDLYDGLAMARFFSTLQLISGVAPIIAPAIGGQILRLTEWRGIFVVCAAVGALLTAVAWRRLHETLPPERRHKGALLSTFGAMRGLLADRVFAGYVLVGSFGFAALFTYVSASSFVVQDIYGASPQTFGLLFGLNSVGIVGVGQLNGKVLVGRVDMDKVIGAGLALITLAATALVLLTTGALGRATLPEIAAALFVLMAAMGLVLPTANTRALLRTRRHAGSASALIGTSSFLIGAALSPLSGVAGDGTAVPMAITQLSCVLVAVGCFVGLCLRGRRTVEGP